MERDLPTPPAVRRRWSRPVREEEAGLLKNTFELVTELGVAQGAPFLWLPWTVLLQRQVHDLVHELRRLSDLGDELQVAYALTDGDAHRMGEDQTRKGHDTTLPLVRLSQHVGVEGEHDAIQFGRAIEEGGVRGPFAAVLLRGHDVDTTDPQTRP